MNLVPAARFRSIDEDNQSILAHELEKNFKYITCITQNLTLGLSRAALNDIAV